MKQRQLWTIGLVLTIILVAVFYYIIFTYKVAFALPKFTVETILIMVAFSFPPSYIGRMTADYVLKQSTHVGDVFKETTVGVAIHWLIYLPELFLYNYVVFGEIMEFPSFSVIRDMIPTGNFFAFIPFMIAYPILVEPGIIKFLHKHFKKKQWYEETNLKNMEGV